MGIGIHELQFVRLLAAERSLGRVLTLARQGISIKNSELESQLGHEIRFPEHGYAEVLLTSALSASSVESVDNSDYEGATYVADLNTAVDLGKRFDTVLDFGTSEHVFDVAALFRNVVGLCEEGGRIAHVVPANSECGHGFYQFSPELFLSLYSDVNGFTNTKVYVATLLDERNWFKVLPAQPGIRIMANALTATFILCTSTKVRDVPALAVQQSDYVHAWEANGYVNRIDRPAIEKIRNKLKGSSIAVPLSTMYRTWFGKTGLTKYNDHLEKVSINSQIATIQS